MTNGLTKINTLEEARKIACCSEYRKFYICIFAGGGSQKEHDMYWGYIIFNAVAERYRYDRLPRTCLDVDDGRRHCERLIDFLLKDLDYEEVAFWRDVCEFM